MKFFARLRTPPTLTNDGALATLAHRVGRLRMIWTLNWCFGTPGVTVYRTCDKDWCAALQLVVLGVNVHFWWKRERRKGWA